MDKITDEQLKTIQEHQRTLNTILNDVGYLEAQKHGLLHQFGDVNRKVEEFKSELENEYGAISINLDDGTYTAIEKEEEEVVEESVANPL
jgi:hypothetical protein|tara:strand:+ start:153 stop:422 length:270 start_codon:yes stop_codon:yes gene_type:complete